MAQPPLNAPDAERIGKALAERGARRAARTHAVKRIGAGQIRRLRAEPPHRERDHDLMDSRCAKRDHDVKADRNRARQQFGKLGIVPRAHQSGDGKQTGGAGEKREQQQQNNVEDETQIDL